jgi:hypothetical protein
MLAPVVMAREGATIEAMPIVLHNELPGGGTRRIDSSDAPAHGAWHLRTTPLVALSEIANLHRVLGCRDSAARSNDLPGPGSVVSTGPRDPSVGHCLDTCNRPMLRPPQGGIEMNGNSPKVGAAPDAVVWIDHDQAVIVEQDRNGTTAVEVVARKPTETEAVFEGRTVDQLAGHERIIVTGPAYARTGFERAYVAVTHRPDRLVDVAPKSGTYRPAI